MLSQSLKSVEVLSDSRKSRYVTGKFNFQYQWDLIEGTYINLAPIWRLMAQMCKAWYATSLAQDSFKLQSLFCIVLFF